MSLRIAIIGGVAGGAGAAAAARRENETAQIDLFEADAYISFANCGLPYYVSGEIADRDELLVTDPELLAQRFEVRVHVRHLVTAIDRDARTIRVRDLATDCEFDHAYDRLVIATGAKAVRPPTPGLDHARIAECRTIGDVDRLKAFVGEHPGGRALVIGGGFIGLEVAEGLAASGLSVTLVELADQVLPPVDPEIAAPARLALEEAGVRVALRTKVEAFEHGDAASVAVLSGGERVPFDFAVLSIGVTPRTELAREANLAIGPAGGLAVDEFQRTSDPAIFAAGDVTELVYWPTGARTRLALAGPANKQARVAGINAAAPAPYMKTTGAAGSSIVRVFEVAVGMTGLSEKAAVQRGVPYRVVYTQNNHHAGYFPGAKPLFIKLLFAPDDGRVLGGQVFGNEGVDKRVDVLATAIQAGFTVDRLAEVDLAYAPPFGSAKDPVIIAGMVASNVVHGRSRTVTPKELAAELASPAPPLVLDVRTPGEYRAARLEGALNVPVDALRGQLERIPRDRPIVVHCGVGYRAYVAEKILRQCGFDDVRNLTGGMAAWRWFTAAAR